MNYNTKGGDTLASISAVSGSSPDTIQALNGMGASTVVYPDGVYNAPADAKDATITGVSDTMLMESGSMPDSLKRSEMLGNEDMATRLHANGTIGFGIDLKQNPKMAKHVLKRAGVSEKDINSLLKGDKSVRLDADKVAKASDYMYSYKYSQLKKIVPKFDELVDEDKTLLADLHYNGAIKKSGYLKNDTTRKELWKYIRAKDMQGLRTFIRTSESQYAKTLKTRLEDRGGYSLLSEAEAKAIAKEAARIEETKGTEAVVAFVKSQGKSFKNMLNKALSYKDKRREVFGLTMPYEYK